MGWAYNPAPWSVSMDYILFFILAVVVVFISYSISHMVNAFDKRTKFTGILIAGTIVALVSSLPEFTSSMVTVHTTGNLSSATGNLMGGNIFRTAMLGLTLICFIFLMKKAKTTVIQVSLVVSEIAIFALYLILTIGGNALHLTGTTADIVFGVFSGVILLVYGVNLFIMFKFGQNEENVEEHQQIQSKKISFQARMTNLFMGMKIYKIVILFVCSSLLIIGSSMVLSIVADHIMINWGWLKDENGPNTSGGENAGLGCTILLGIVTSIPETITVITLLKLKNVNAAISDILGSNLFSCLILSVVDMSYWPDPHKLSNGAEHRDAIFVGDAGYVFAILSLWSLVSMIMIGGVLLLNHLYRNKKHNWLYYTLVIFCLSIVFLSYVASLISLLPNTDYWLYDPWIKDIDAVTPANGVAFATLVSYERLDLNVLNVPCFKQNMLSLWRI